MTPLQCSGAESGRAALGDRALGPENGLNYSAAIARLSSSISVCSMRRACS